MILEGHPGTHYDTGGATGVGPKKLLNAKERFANGLYPGLRGEVKNRDTGGCYGNV